MSNLGTLVSDLLALLRAQAEAWEDGPVHEVSSLIARAQERELLAFARANGFESRDDLRRAIEARTSPRWVHFNLGGL